MLTDTEVQLCHWHWIPGCAGSHVWTNDPEFRRSKGGGGIVVGRVEEVKPKRGTKGRSSERIVLVRPQFRGGEWVYWIGGMKKYLKTSEIRELGRAEAFGQMMSYDAANFGPAFTSTSDVYGCNVLLRIGKDGAIRNEDGGRVGRKGDWVPIVLRKGDAVGEMAVSVQTGDPSWVFVHGSSRSVKFRVSTECLAKLPGHELFGDVAVLGTDGQWREIMPDAPGPKGRYAFSVKNKYTKPESDGSKWEGWTTFRMTFAEIVRGIQQ